MDIYQALQDDHRRIQTLLNELLTASEADNDEWKHKLDELRNIVLPHAHAEEAVLYDALREDDEGKKVVAHSYREHKMAAGEIHTLGLAKMVDANWTSLMKKLSKDLNHHIDDEEGKVFTAARQIFSESEAQQMGEAFLRRKEDEIRKAA